MFLLLSGMVFMLSSCSSDDELSMQPGSKQDAPFTIKSGLTDEQMAVVKDSLDKYLGLSVRAGAMDFTEEQAEAILQPLTNDGMQIRNQMLASASELGLTQDDVDFLQRMKGEQCAALSYTAYQMGNVAMQKVTAEKFVGCLTQAIGLEAIESIGNIITGTKQLFTVKETLKICRALAKRWIGYLGVALVVYDFADCITK